MAVENFICKDCLCANVCEVKKKLMKFDSEAKTQLPTDIHILSCEDYKQIKQG